MALLMAVPPGLIQQRVLSAPNTNEDRQQAIAQMFRDAGCAGTELRPLKHSKFSNAVCTVPGTSGGTIVVGGHYDHVKIGKGIIDNWSGASMVADLIQALNGSSHKHSFVFVAFAREEEGLLGSRDFVSHLSKPEVAQISAMINLDSLGAGPLVVWRSHSNARLYDFSQAVGPLGFVDVDQFGISDSAPFKEKKVAVIDFHSLRPSTIHILHSADDNEKSLKLEDYVAGFTFLTSYLDYIDRQLP
jgi:Iap family predicted aminopeptidase